MSDAEQRDIAEALFEPKQSREEIKDAIKLEEVRRAATIKNLYRLKSCACRATKPAHSPKIAPLASKKLRHLRNIRRGASSLASNFAVERDF